MSKLAAMREADQIAGASIWLEAIAKQCLDGEATNLDVAHLVSIGTHQARALARGPHARVPVRTRGVRILVFDPGQAVAATDKQTNKQT